MNSIDAKAKNITLVRGKEKGNSYLKITDDGQGIPQDETGRPDFKYVATHICDSIKRQLKTQGLRGLQGEFGIGLLSFWTVGEELILTSSGADGKSYQMLMAKGNPDYTVQPRRALFAQQGTELLIQNLLPGIKQLSGEKLQWYLASELRDRIRSSGVQIKIVDRQSRKEFKVEPRKFSGRLLHDLPALESPHGNIYVELYLTESNPNNQIGLCRLGTRVLEKIDQLEIFQKAPWNLDCFQGLIDVPFLNLTPGTRSGIIQDDYFSAFCFSLAPLEETLNLLVENQRKAEEEQTSREILSSIKKAFLEALTTLPDEEYDWFEIKKRQQQGSKNYLETLASNSESASFEGAPVFEDTASETSSEETDSPQKQFFEFSGPLFSVKVSPASCLIPVGGSKNFRAVSRDRSRRLVEEKLSYEWKILEGEGDLEVSDSEVVVFIAPQEPALTRLQVTVTQRSTVCSAEALITVTDSLLPKAQESESPTTQGLPGYTFQKAPGQLWRSRFLPEQNVVVINNAHRDFVYASRNKSLKLKYICRLFAKELVFKNFPGIPPDQLLERMIELGLYTEENLK
ncbi:MAG: ATP-binding protein [Deltaproteobacteria bacterium]|nr:ATP-binding protein [Deltaproteobacteria bacterium]